jgi:hypothetical protein
MPMNEIDTPKTACREGLSFNMKFDTKIEKMGVVFTRTVALRIVVSFTAEMKNTKWSPRKKLRIRSCLMFLLKMLKLNDFPDTINTAVSARLAITRRQKAIEKASRLSNRMKTDAVPKRTPAIKPSVKACLLVRPSI